MTDDLNKLKSIYNRIADLEHSSAILDWDQETYMPAQAGTSRAHQVTTLTTMAHELATSTEVGNLLSKLAQDVASLPPLHDDRKLVEVGLEDFEKSSRLSSALVGRIASAVSLAKDSWREARQNNDFEKFLPNLQELVDLNSEKAEALGYDDHIYDALLDEYEPDLKTSSLNNIFSRLREELVGLVARIADADTIDNSVVRRHYDAQKQWEFGVSVIKDFGYDFERGRQDHSAHPFTTTFSIDDVRITTRIDENFFNPGLFGTLHEAGHALYEQGVDHNLERLPLASGTSLGMHESQSRLWENLIGRSRPFWNGYFPRLSTYFPDVASNTNAEDFYKAVNRVRPSLIRVEADEVTYNLHIMVRFELEKALFERSVTIADLPDLWNEKMRDYLGIVPPTNDKGVLQDIHWALGAFGYFPTYTLGNLMSTQLFDQIRIDIPEIDELTTRGDFRVLREWLRNNIHKHGRKLKAAKILEDVTGSPLSPDSWLRYVNSKYSELYDLN